MDIAAHAGPADVGLLQKRLEEVLCWILPHAPLPPLPRSLPVKGLTKTDIILMVIVMEMNDVTDGQYNAQDGGDSKGCGGGQLGVWLCLWAGLGNKVKEENACVADFYWPFSNGRTVDRVLSMTWGTSCSCESKSTEEDHADDDAKLWRVIV